MSGLLRNNILLSVKYIVPHPSPGAKKVIIPSVLGKSEALNWSLFHPLLHIIGLKSVVYDMTRSPCSSTMLPENSVTRPSQLRTTVSLYTRFLSSRSPTRTLAAPFLQVVSHANRPATLLAWP